MKNELTAKRLRQAISEMNLKPQELADLSGVNKASISQYLNGSHAPSNISSGKMGKILNVDPLWLMGFDVPMRKTKDESEANKDFELLEKFSILNNNEKEMVIGMIDLMISKKREVRPSPTSQ